jgi:hypothetical protein
MKITIKSIQMSAYCLCGASITCRGIDPAKAIAEWRKGHTGPGCGPVDRKGAIKAKRDKKKQRQAETPKEQLSLFKVEG